MSEFQTQVVQWLDAQTTLYQDKISKRRAEYLQKKWPWDEKKDAPDFTRRRDALKSLRSSMLLELSYEKAHGQNLLDLLSHPLIFRPKSPTIPGACKGQHLSSNPAMG